MSFASFFQGLTGGGVSSSASFSGAGVTLTLNAVQPDGQVVSQTLTNSEANAGIVSVSSVDENGVVFHHQFFLPQADLMA
jgi:hypothetical protein